jgi:hypothetical protein
MKDMLLMGAIKARNFADDMADRAVRAAKGENGDVVQTVIIIGIFVVICVVVGGMIFKAMEAQGTKLSTCISGVNTSTGCSTFKK